MKSRGDETRGISHVDKNMWLKPRVDFQLKAKTQELRKERADTANANLQVSVWPDFIQIPPDLVTKINKYLCSSGCKIDKRTRWHEIADGPIGGHWQGEGRDRG